MSKYEKFISDLNNEIDNLDIIDVKDKVKSKYVYSKAKNKSFSLFAKPLTLAAFSIILFLVSFVFIKISIDPAHEPKKPIIASSIEDAYAFEMMTAANYLYTDATTNLKRRQRNNDLNNICDKINRFYLTINQLLRKEKIEYKITNSDNDMYENKMVINSFFNDNFDLYYTIYFNKSFIEKDDDEEIYNLNGIIIINNINYEIIGETIVEEDEVETKIKVLINETEYFIIEQEKEDDEEKFVYKTYVNNKLTKEVVISYEIENKDIEIKLELNTSSRNEEIKAKYKNNELILKVEFNDYEGKIKVIDSIDSISYYFINEKVTINKKIIKN